ncbi:MAG: PP2C family serine/threonine-protein phosphatase [Armatimonadota bacterium]
MPRDRTTTSYGASVRGPLHRSESAANQDAWMRASGRYGALVVVCDGMGSRPNSHLGAKAACTAVREAATIWAAAEDAPVQLLAYLVEVIWRVRIHPLAPAEAATTCLLALARKDGVWIVGGVGDGLAIVKDGDAPVQRLTAERSAGFGNETKALGASRGSRDWSLSELPATSNSRTVVLTTDGIADDLIPERLEEFFGWIVEDFRNDDPSTRWRRIAKDLQNWLTPKHLDDKTVAVLSVDAELVGRKGRPR